VANEQSRQPLADNAPPVATEAPQVDVEERQRKASAAMQQSEQRVAAVRQTLQNYQEGKTDSPGLITEVADQVMKGGLPFEHAQSILRSTITDWNAVDIDAAFQRVLAHKARRAKQESPTPVPPPTATGLAPQPQLNQEPAHGLQAEAQAQAALNQTAPTEQEGARAKKEPWQSALQQSEQRTDKVRGMMRDYRSGDIDKQTFLTQLAEQVAAGELTQDHLTAIMRGLWKTPARIDYDDIGWVLREGHKAERLPAPPTPESAAAPEGSPSAPRALARKNAASVEKAQRAIKRIKEQAQRAKDTGKTSQSRKKMMETDMATLRLHADKLGVPVRDAGTYFSEDTYGKIASEVETQLQGLSAASVEPAAAVEPGTADPQQASEATFAPSPASEPAPELATAEDSLAAQQQDEGSPEAPTFFARFSENKIIPIPDAQLVDLSQSPRTKWLAGTDHQFVVHRAFSTSEKQEDNAYIVTHVGTGRTIRHQSETRQTAAEAISAARDLLAEVGEAKFNAKLATLPKLDAKLPPVAKNPTSALATAETPTAAAGPPLLKQDWLKARNAALKASGLSLKALDFGQIIRLPMVVTSSDPTVAPYWNTVFVAPEDREALGVTALNLLLTGKDALGKSANEAALSGAGKEAYRVMLSRREPIAAIVQRVGQQDLPGDAIYSAARLYSIAELDSAAQEAGFKTVRDWADSFRAQPVKVTTEEELRAALWDDVERKPVGKAELPDGTVVFLRDTPTGYTVVTRSSGGTMGEKMGGTAMDPWGGRTALNRAVESAHLPKEAAKKTTAEDAPLSTAQQQQVFSLSLEETLFTQILADLSTRNQLANPSNALFSKVRIAREQI